MTEQELLSEQTEQELFSEKTEQELLNEKLNRGSFICPDMAVVLEAISEGADINYVDEDGWCLLHKLALNPRYSTAITEAIIDAGADVHATTVYGQTPLNVALRNASLAQILSFLYKTDLDLDKEEEEHFFAMIDDLFRTMENFLNKRSGLDTAKRLQRRLLLLVDRLDS